MTFARGAAGAWRRAAGPAVAVATAVLLAACGGGGSGNLPITTTVLSSMPEWVSGGDTLLKVNNVPEGSTMKVLVNGTVSADAFATDPADGKPVVLVTGLANGKNEITVEASASSGVFRATQQVTNFPRTGPMFSGPWETPYACQTDTFRLYPNGPFAGAATDANCSIATRVDYVYRNAAGAFVALPSQTAVPADAATTVTTEGRTVPYIVRIETGTVNRAIYQTAVLHNPAAGTTPSPTVKANGWNGKLVYTFGGGCTGGWYRQGNSTGGVLDDPILKQGYAMASSTLNVFGNNCQDVTPSETMAMVKERFIETYGAPRYTMGFGCSGGSYQQYQIGDNYPGLLDGIIPGCSFPEVLFATVYSITDFRLLGNYFRNTAPGTFTAAQQRAVAGVQTEASIYTETNYNGAMRIAPNEWTALDGTTRTFCPAQVPVAQRYNPVTNRTGVRCDVYDHAVNLLGRDPATGFARRPLDNVGVQYGLNALKAGLITVDQFLDLNERLGGYDVDANFQAARTVADTAAVRQAYRTGRLTNAGGGLANIPIIDYRAYADDQAIGDIHLRYHSFSMRERLIKANGDADNQVMLHEDFRFGYYSSSSPLLLRALAEMDKWIAAIQADAASGNAHAKVVRNKPASLQEGCNTRDATPTFVAEKMTVASGQCAAIYPVPAAPRSVAGAPLAADVIKCTLKPVSMADYTGVTFTAAQTSRLNTIYPTGVCNYAVPGVEQQGLQGTWLAY
ncbi:MAG: hypothetical protein JWP22_4034 [Ramlibacter sp.]|nr:hypothetical protein [Ramlibacter sp.]